jgi:quercetin dioxygenase-like cupin family protein
MADPLYKRMTAFLLEVGINDQAHTGKTYIGHLLAVHRLLEAQGCGTDACRASLFHSVYGTEQFQGFKLPLERRDEVRAIIGERAERLAYLNCAMDRASFDAALARSEPPYAFRDRLSGGEVALDRADFDDLCRVHLYDWLEQVPRSRYGYAYRRAAYRRIAERLGTDAVAAYDRVFAGEPKTADAVIAIDAAALPWEERFNEKLGRVLYRKNLITDPDTGMEVRLVRYPAGVINVRHKHPCAHGMYVLEGKLVTHAGTFGPGCFVWFPEGTVMEHGASAEGDVTVVFITNKPFEIHYL